MRSLLTFAALAATTAGPVHGDELYARAALDEAAEAYEADARLHPRGQDMPRMLERAALLRLGLGDEARAEADAEALAPQLGAGDPTRWANVLLAIAAHRADQDDWQGARAGLLAAQPALDHLAPLDLRIRAHALLGRAGAGLDDARTASTEYWIAHSLARHPDAIVAATTSGDLDEAAPARLGRALTAEGEAIFFFAERERAAVDRMALPAFRGPETRASTLRYLTDEASPWMKRKVRAIEALSALYAKILAIEPAAPPLWSIAAAERVGRTWAAFLDDLHGLPTLPMDPELRALYEEYGNNVDSFNAPFDQRVKEVYATCLSTAVKHQIWNDDAAACEAWLVRHHRSEYPTAEGLHRGPRLR